MFQGSLEEVTLPDVIQLMSVSSKTGHFILERDSDEGRVYMVKGQIVHATCGALSGVDAIYALAVWNKGQFQFQAGDTSTTKTITEPNTQILMELARRLDEWSFLSKRIPSLELIPELHALDHKQRGSNTQEQKVHSKINGVNSITQIAAMTKMSAIEVAKLIYGLVASDLVRLRETPKQNSDGNPLEQPEKVQPKVGRTPEQEKEWLHVKTEKINLYAKSVLSEMTHSLIQRHCADTARAINQARGISAVIEGATHIVKTSQKLEGSEKIKELTIGLKKIIKEA